MADEVVLEQPLHDDGNGPATLVIQLAVEGVVARAARPLHHCRIRPAARKGRVLRREVKNGTLTPYDGVNHGFMLGRRRRYGRRRDERSLRMAARHAHERDQRERI